MKTYTKRVSALVVALLMLLSVFSMSAFAWGTDEGIEVYWNNTYVATVKYDDMDAAISQTSDVTYAGMNNYGTYKSYTGKVYTLNDLLAAVGKTNDWATAADTATLSLITPDEETATYTKSQLTEMRYYYTQSGTVVSSVPVGFMKRISEDDSYFKFVFGQTAATEKNVPKFWDLTGSGNTKVYIWPNASPSQAGALYAQVNGTGTTYAPGSTIIMHENDVLQFNYYDTNYLNTTMVYYTWGDINSTVPDPGINDASTCYITQAPMYGGVFKPFEFVDDYYWCTIRVIGVKYGCTNSNVCTFTVRLLDE